MKATINACGMLCITPETGIEAYAISQWASVNLRGESNVIVDCSSFPSMIGLHASDCAVHNEPAFPAGPCDCEAAHLTGKPMKHFE